MDFSISGTQYEIYALFAIALMYLYVFSRTKETPSNKYDTITKAIRQVVSDINAFVLMWLSPDKVPKPKFGKKLKKKYSDDIQKELKEFKQTMGEIKEQINNAVTEVQASVYDIHKIREDVNILKKFHKRDINKSNSENIKK